MASKESKYERVEKVEVDSDGSARVKDVAEDRGKEDPGMNFQDKRPANLVAGAQSGLLPGQNRESLPTDKAGQRLRDHLNESMKRREGKTSSSSTTTNVRSSNESRYVEPQIGYRGAVDLSNLRKDGSQGQTGVSSQRTTVVTETHTQGGQRTVPIIPHQGTSTHDVITHDTKQRSEQVHTVTIPTTQFQSAQLESTREGRTFTEDKELSIPAPNVAAQIQHQQVNLSGGTSATIHATTDLHLASEAQIDDMSAEEYARYRARVEALARQHEEETARKAATYREQIEKDAELIRQTLERQHMRDIEFRKDMVETAVDRQQQEIKLEAEYAMRALEQERANAHAALDSAKASSNIDVNIDSAIGTTHSQGRVTTTSETKSSGSASRQ